jgi:MIP family channel proteins
VLRSSLEASVSVALVFGGTVASLILLLGKRSGAHINPAITIAHGLAGRFKRELFIPYVAFQLVGALLAGLTLRVAFGPPGESIGLGSTRLAAGVTPIEGIVIEAAGTFVLALAALSASSLSKAPANQAILIGATLFVLIVLIGPVTGASFNPARSLGPSLFSGYFGSQFVYWVGPLVGAGCAGLLFKVLTSNNGRTRKLAIVCVC